MSGRCDSPGILLVGFKWLKAGIRAMVEHPLHVVTNLFRHGKVRCRELAKSKAQLLSLFGFVKLVFARKQLVALNDGCSPCMVNRSRCARNRS